MKNVKNWRKQSREQRKILPATQENKQIKSGLECAKVNEENKAARELAIQIKLRGAKMLTN
jgi:hypothetical protein